MRKTNCVNCGAAIDWDANKCPYCGTQYIDFTEIDFTSAEPLVLRTKHDYHGKTVIIEQCAFPRFGTISVANDYVEARNSLGVPLLSFSSSTDVETELAFKATPFKDGSLFKIKFDD